MYRALSRKLSCGTTAASIPRLATQTRTIASGVTERPPLVKRESFLDEFNRTHEPPPKSIKYFSSIPWTKKVIETDGYRMIPFYSRYLIDSTGESRFFSETVNTETTVAHVLGFCRKDLATSDDLANQKTSATDNTTSVNPDVVCLMHLGRDLESHPGIVQGGFLGSIFDEVMYQVLLLHENKDPIVYPRPKHYTLSITTKFHAPVNAPSDVVVRATLAAREGRKWFVNAQIEDGDGKILTSGESSWLTARSSPS